MGNTSVPAAVHDDTEGQIRLASAPAGLEKESLAQVRLPVSTAIASDTTQCWSIFAHTCVYGGGLHVVDLVTSVPEPDERRRIAQEKTRGRLWHASSPRAKAG
jgi:hypothetical protein